MTGQDVRLNDLLEKLVKAGDEFYDGDAVTVSIGVGVLADTFAAELIRHGCGEAEDIITATGSTPLEAVYNLAIAFANGIGKGPHVAALVAAVNE